MILQARILEWVAIAFSNAWKWKVKGKSLSCVRLLGTPWTAAHQAPPSMGFSRQQYWSRLPLPSPQRCSVAIKTNKPSPWENPKEKGESDFKSSYIKRFTCPVSNKINLKVYKETEKCGLFRGGGCLFTTDSCPTLATLWTVTRHALCLWNSPGKNTGVGCQFLLQGIFPTQGSNPGILHCRWMDSFLTEPTK